MIQRINQYWNTLRYLDFRRQIISRLMAEAKLRWRRTKLPNPPAGLAPKLAPKVPFLTHDPWNQAEGMENGLFTFLNETHSINIEREWSANRASLLWNFNLHYFHYLCVLHPEKQEALCLKWINNVSEDDRVAWHPYPLSLRIVSWIKSNPTHPAILDSLYQQAHFLFHNLERHHPGNHYLENAKALIFAGLMFSNHEDAHHWFDRGIRIFEQEFPTQILSDGGYFERSTMYHALMCELLLDIINVLPKKHPFYNRWSQISLKMLSFLQALTHPNGQIALFNDSTYEIAPSTDALLAYGKALIKTKPVERNHFENSGFYVYRDSKIYFVIDGGPLGPDKLPAHAHCDLFSYEMSLQGIPFIINSGVFEYQAGDRRSYSRSSAAHNTVQVDEVDQADCWSSFRLGKRGHPSSIHSAESDFDMQFMGSYDGFSKMIGDDLQHTRQVEGSKHNSTIEVIDSLTGAGKHSLQSFIHFHPECEVFLGQGRCQIQRGGIQMTITWDPDSVHANTAQTPFFPNFGVEQKKTTLILEKKARLPFSLEYEIKY